MKITYEQYIRLLEAQNILICLKNDLQNIKGHAKKGKAEIVNRLDNIIGEIDNIVFDS